jgi:hypothetical protein
MYSGDIPKLWGAPPSGGGEEHEFMSCLYEGYLFSIQHGRKIKYVGRRFTSLNARFILQLKFY